jgi:adenosylcobinamide-phosphate synthase
MAGAMLLDMIVGDPRWYPHPVRFIGWLCSRGEHYARNRGGNISLKTRGVLCSCMVILVSVGCALCLLATGYYLNPIIGTTLAGFIIYMTISTGDLITHSRAVLQALNRSDIETGRLEVSMMVGRDTAEMDEEAIVRACIESVSENLVDGTTAVLFWAFAASLLGSFFGLPMSFGAALGAVFYRAVNTMDSMYGYLNERYAEFGWFAARMDDLANFIPARITGGIVIVSAFLMNYAGGCALKTFTSDRLKSPSPNSAHTEAAVAGALRVQLGGVSTYSGRVSEKPLLGASLGRVDKTDITRANRLVVGSSFVFLIIGGLVHLMLVNLV